MQYSLTETSPIHCLFSILTAWVAFITFFFFLHVFFQWILDWYPTSNHCLVLFILSLAPIFIILMENFVFLLLAKKSRGPLLPLLSLRVFYLLCFAFSILIHPSWSCSRGTSLKINSGIYWEITTLLATKFASWPRLF